MTNRSVKKQTIKPPSFGDEKEKKEPLLTIELENMNSVPIIKYKGEEIKRKTHVNFDWKQEDEDSLGGAEFEIEHHSRDGEGIGHLNTIKKVSIFKG